jgi:hypothetical protein
MFDYRDPTLGVRAPANHACANDAGHCGGNPVGPRFDLIPQKLTLPARLPWLYLTVLYSAAAVIWSNPRPFQ